MALATPWRRSSLRTSLRRLALPARRQTSRTRLLARPSIGMSLALRRIVGGRGWFRETVGTANDFMIRSVRRADVVRRYRLRCIAEWSGLTEGLRAIEHPAASHLPCAQHVPRA